MRTFKFFLNSLWKSVPVLFILFGITAQTFAQEISAWQFRKVEQADMEEFIERETKYWSKVAEAAIEKGNLTFWGLFVKQGGFDIPNSPNVIFINTFNDIEAANMSEIWNASALFPEISIEDMQTESLSSTMHMLFVRPENWVAKQDLSPEEGNFVRFIFHNTNSPADLITLESDHWGPFIKSAMEDGKTSQVAWGNATILAPSGPNMQASTISYDVFPTFTSALQGGFEDATDVEFPEEGLTNIMELEDSPRFNSVYRRIQVVGSVSPD